MLSHLLFLLSPALRARRAWMGGKPQAPSPEEANEQWSSHVPHWSRLCARENFVTTFGLTPHEGQLGWLRSPVFWSAYWKAFDEHCKNNVVFALNPPMRERTVEPLVVTAALTRNMGFFLAAKSMEARATVKMCLVNNMHIIFDPCILDWLTEHGGVVPSAFGPAQAGLWDKRLVWRRTPGDSPLFVGRGKPDMAASVDLLVDGFTRWNLCAEQQIRALGHLFSNCPAQWFASDGAGATIVEHLRQRLGAALDGVDIDAVAMCCGFGPTTQPLARAIQTLGLGLLNGQADWGELEAPEAQVLVSLYDISNPMALYRALMSTGLHRAEGTVPAPQWELPALD